jgi:hypothetical protein
MTGSGGKKLSKSHGYIYSSELKFTFAISFAKLEMSSPAVSKYSRMCLLLHELNRVQVEHNSCESFFKRNTSVIRV